MKIRPVGVKSCSMRKDRHDEFNGHFSKCCQRA